MRRDVRVQRFYPHPPALVWRALTEPELLAAWLMPNDFRAEVGHRFTFRTDPAPGFDGIVHAEVLAIDPLRLLELSWRGGPLDTRVSFRLKEAIVFAHPGTSLVIEHTGFEGVQAILTSLILQAGWASMRRKTLGPLLDRLARGGPMTPEKPAHKSRGLWYVLAKVFAPSA